MASVPQDNPVFQEAYYSAPVTTRLDRFPPASITEELAQLEYHLPPWLLILLDGVVIATVFCAVILLIYYAACLSVWSGNDGIAVLAAIGCAAIIYAAFGRKTNG